MTCSPCLLTFLSIPISPASFQRLNLSMTLPLHISDSQCQATFLVRFSKLRLLIEISINLIVCLLRAIIYTYSYHARCHPSCQGYRYIGKNYCIIIFIELTSKVFKSTKATDPEDENLGTPRVMVEELTLEKVT